MWISDGSAYLKHLANYNTESDQGYQCMVINHPDWRVGDALCGRQRDFACEFRCDTGENIFQISYDID